MPLRPPPYARELRRLSRRGAVAEVWLYCGGREAWGCARARVRADLPTLVLPAGEDPAEFIWPVEGLTVLVVAMWGDEESQMPHLALALLSAGARRVVAVVSDGLRVFTQ